MGMEHKQLSLEYDRNLINKILDDINMRYVVLFLYIIRNDLFQDFMDQDILDSYQRVLVLDEIYKGNIISFWDENFTDTAVDLGLFKNIRTVREFEQKDQDFIVKLGEETVTFEDETMLVPDDTLFRMIRKKFKFLTRRNFNLALTRLKGVRCEVTGVIHPFIYQIGDHDYTISDDLYYILDQFGNIYQAIKMEDTIEGFYKRFDELKTKIDEFLSLYDSDLNKTTVVKKINQAIEQKKDIFKHLKDEKVSLPEKFKFGSLNKNNENFQKWYRTLIDLLNYRYQLEEIDEKLMEIRTYYSGKNKKFSYLEFIEKVSFNEDDIVNTIGNALIDLRKEIVKINDEISKLTKKEVKLMNLDYERYKLMEE